MRMCVQAARAVVACSAIAAVTALGGAASGQVVISQVWGGGGFIGSGPNADTVELFNAGTSPVSLAGLSLQYRGGTSTAAINPAFGLFALSGTIQPKQYFLVRLENPTATGFATDTPDQTFTAIDPISVNRGQLFLVQGTAALAAGCPAGLNGNTAILDFLGYGRGFNNDNSDCPGTFCAVCREGTSSADNAPGGTSSSSAVWIRRRCGGLQDTNNNFNDWERVGPGVSAPSAFRNSASPANTSGVSITPGPVGASAFPGQSLSITATASSDCGTVTGVSVNLTPIGGSANQALALVGVNQFALTTTVGAGITPGVKTLVLTATAAGGLTSSASLDVIVRTSNDECAGAITLTGSGPYAWSNIGGTTGTDGQGFSGCDNGGSLTGPIESDVWYRWTAPASGEFTVSTIGSVGAVQPGDRFDARIAVYADGCPPGLPLACNDDATLPDGPAARTSFAASAGVTYLIQIGADDPQTFTGQGVLTFTAGAAGACCFGDAQCTQVASAADCLALNGTFQDTGSTCANEVCPGFPGACCFTDFISGLPACNVTDRFFCTQVLQGQFGLGLTCDPDPCPLATTGRCCVGARCVITDEAACTAGGGLAGTAFAVGGLDCNTATILNTPCCFADYNKQGGISVQDIFDFLTDYFTGSVNANVAGDGTTPPSVQDIFDYLTAYFAGGC